MVKGLRAYLTFNAVVALLSGIAFLLVPLQMASTQGPNISAGEVIFIRSVGGLILSIAVLDWYARDLKDQKMMQGVLLTNFLVHATSVTIDTMAVFAGTIHGGTEWYNISIRGLIALGFVYFLLKKSPKKSQ